MSHEGRCPLEYNLMRARIIIDVDRAIKDKTLQKGTQGGEKRL